MHARSENLHDGARSAPEIFRRLAARLPVSYFQKPKFSAFRALKKVKSSESTMAMALAVARDSSKAYNTT